MISEQIRLLLHENDCVVVPGLGGFILNHLPAAYDEKERRFYPARALPFFNKQLQSNDGLLASALVKTRQFDYSSAVQEISRFSVLVKETLEDKREYIMPGLGEFKQNQDGQITFYPNKESNADAETYGLDSLELEPLVKPKKVQRPGIKPLRQRSASWITMAASLIIIAIGAWSLTQMVDSPSGKQWSMLNPFSEWYKGQQSPDNYRDVDSQQIVEDESRYSSGEVKDEVVDANTQNQEPIAQDPEPVTQNPEPITQNPEPIYTNSGTDSVYYIVVGAFKHAGNAGKLERKLKNEGYSACTYQEENTEWIRVCAEKHTKRFEAEERLAFVRSTANNKAWILATANDIP